MFITTLPLHVYLEPEQTLRDTVQQVAETMGLVSENKETPLPDIERLAGSAPLFDTTVVYDHHAHFGMPNGLAGADTTEPRPRIQVVRAAGRTHYPLTVVCPPGDVLEIVLEHRLDVVSHALPDAAARWFTTFLSALCDGPSSGETLLVDLLPKRAEFEGPAATRADTQEELIQTSGMHGCPEERPVTARAQEAMESMLGKSIGFEGNFFASGGDPLLAIRLMGLLRKQGLPLKIQDIVDAGTPAAIAERLGGGCK